jgi:hemolysin D
MKEERKKNILSEIVELDKRINELKTKNVKAEESYKYQKLISPVNGTVHGLSSYTIGGILKPAETAITIVPEGTKFMAEVLILNKDIGYVKQKQEVEVKVEAFPFQKFGTINGKIETISPDANQDEKMGYVYKALVSLETNYFMLDGRSRLISPGMTLTAEIKTGKRRIIDFFLSPIVKNSDEGLKVR